jgi:hypothetical protein
VVSEASLRRGFKYPVLRHQQDLVTFKENKGNPCTSWRCHLLLAVGFALWRISGSAEYSQKAFEVLFSERVNGFAPNGEQLPL